MLSKFWRFDEFGGIVGGKIGQACELVERPCSYQYALLGCGFDSEVAKAGYELFDIELLEREEGLAFGLGKLLQFADIGHIG